MILDEKDGFVIYKLPNSSNHLLRKGNWKEFSNQKNGFIVNSFSNNQKYILENKAYPINENISVSAPNHKDLDTTLGKEEYIIQLNHFISSCNHNLKKVISSRKIITNTEKQVDLFFLFNQLALNYDNALVYLINIPRIGMWMGATPETLVYSDNKKIYTVALAGTKAHGNNIIWEEKEKIEHQYVIDDISDKLTSQGIGHEIENTKTVKAAQVAHLKTVINFKKHNNTNIIAIANSLHPTSAVCGMPQEKAKEFIIKNENYDRAFYTGYLGEIDESEKSWLFVNLRCMQVFNKSFSLYVGGGITKDSDAEKEWEETELKSRTLLSVIEKL